MMERAERAEIDRRELGAYMRSLRRAMKERIDAGLLPYQGRWVPLAEVQAGIARERRRAWVHAFELLLLYGVMAIVSLGLLGLAVYLCY